MQSTSERNLYEYAVIRYIPDVEREEFVNVGLIMMCKRKKWIKCRVTPNHRLIAMFNPCHTPDVIDRQLSSFTGIAEGDSKSGPIASLEMIERFRWLTAVKSASFQTSRPHPGLAENLDDTFESLYAALVH